MPVTAATGSNSHYHLELQPQKENVFVTQLHERDDSDDIRRFPVVKESADKLLRSGVNTLQSTSLLRQAVDVENVDRDLEEKREEFRKRMEACKIKEEELQIRRQKIKDRVTKFDKFLKENEAKRNRALKKYQHEVKQNEIKAKELKRLNLELQTLKKQDEMLKKRLEKNKIFELYLTKVIDILPENYLEMTGDSMIQSIIQRHEGLSATNRGLVERNHTVQEGTESGQKELEDLRQEFSKQKLIFNSELASLQEQKEKYMEKNRILEQRATTDHQKKRNFMRKFGQVLMGIDNLAHHSHRRHWPAMVKMSYTQKLSMVQEYVLERIGVEKMVRNMMLEAEIHSTSLPAAASTNTKSIASVGTQGLISPDSTFPKKHNALPPIVKINKPSYTGDDQRYQGKAGGNFLERLTAISEI